MKSRIIAKSGGNPNPIELPIAVEYGQNGMTAIDNVWIFLFFFFFGQIYRRGNEIRFEGIGRSRGAW
jgi:hypothetical protein